MRLAYLHVYLTSGVIPKYLLFVSSRCSLSSKVRSGADSEARGKRDVRGFFTEHPSVSMFVDEFLRSFVILFSSDSSRGDLVAVFRVEVFSVLVYLRCGPVVQARFDDFPGTARMLLIPGF